MPGVPGVPGIPGVPGVPGTPSVSLPGVPLPSSIVVSTLFGIVRVVSVVIAPVIVKVRLETSQEYVVDSCTELSIHRETIIVTTARTFV